MLFVCCFCLDFDIHGEHLKLKKSLILNKINYVSLGKWAVLAHGALVSTWSLPAGRSSAAAAPSDGHMCANSLQVPPGQLCSFMLASRAPREAEPAAPKSESRMFRYF